MPNNVVKTKEDEKTWEEAKSEAKKQGKGDNYAYIMSIYNSMTGESDKEASLSLAMLRAYTRSTLTNSS